MKNANAYQIRLLTLVALSAAGVFSVANTGALATDGLLVVTFLLIAATGFLLPCVLITGELGSRFHGEGGVFDWVSSGMGKRWGVTAAAAQWAQNLPFLPFVFAFAAAAIASLIDPVLMSNKVWTFVVMVVFIWAGTIANFFSVKLSSRFVTFGFVLGNIIPAILLPILAGLWIAKGHPSELPFDLSKAVPKFELEHLMIFTGVMLSLFGIEVAAPLVNRVANPRRTFPLAMAVAGLIIVGGYAISVLPVAVAVPAEKISLEYGVLTAFEHYADTLGFSWLFPLVAMLLILGVAAVGLVWILTPARTMQAMAEDKLIPRVFAKKNKTDMPVGALLIQGVIASLFSLPVLFLPNVGSAFFLSLAAAAQLHLMMYMILFAAFIRIKWSKDEPPAGAFVIPGGKVLATIISIIGIITCLVAFFVGFIPPPSVANGSVEGVAIYLGVLIASITIMVLASFLTTRKISTR